LFLPFPPFNDSANFPKMTIDQLIPQLISDMESVPTLDVNMLSSYYNKTITNNKKPYFCCYSESLLQYNVMKKLVVLTGAGVSAESGLKTFRDMGGLWEEYNVTEVASPEGWAKNMELVLRFYNERRRQLHSAMPNPAHLALAELEKYFDVIIITQNVDDLHERAGSKKVLHLHGELKKSQSTGDPELIYEINGTELNPGDKCEKGFQLRPYIVWFGEAVPEIARAADICSTADIFLVVGTSLNVYPAAGLIHSVPPFVPVFLIDPNEVDAPVRKKYTFIRDNAGTGVQKLKKILLEEYL